MHRKPSAFTLIELLIVVAIIAILAAIAVPNFLEAQVRSKISRAKADMRSLATAVESYKVDHNVYPATRMTLQETYSDNVQTVHTGLPAPSRWRFSFYVNTPTQQMHQITTPLAYITSYFPEPFPQHPGLTYCFVHSSDPDRYTDDYGTKNGSSWIMYCNGPQRIRGGGSYGLNRQMDGDRRLILTNGSGNPTDFLLSGQDFFGNGAFTYDPTNGTTSYGEMWRVGP